MIETISPVVHGGRNRSYHRAVALHVLGATASGAAFGALLGLAGLVVGAPWGSTGLWVLAAVGALYAAREVGGVPVPLPDLDRQVPDWWRTFFSRDVAAFLYGAGLGVGFFTYLSFGTLVAVAAAALISGDPLLGAGLLGTFGFARGLSVLVVARIQPSEVLDALDSTALRAKAALLNGAALIVVVLMAVLEI